jgi:hypothetical protein
MPILCRTCNEPQSSYHHVDSLHSPTPHRFRAKITPESMFAALDRAVETQGADYVYPLEHRFSFDMVDNQPYRDLVGRNETCVYFDPEAETECPRCLFGSAFAFLGYSPADICEGKSVVFNLLKLITGQENTATHELVDPPLQNLVWACEAAQSAQDMSSTWGTAVERARTVFAEREAKLVKP